MREAFAPSVKSPAGGEDAEQPTRRAAAQFAVPGTASRLMRWPLFLRLSNCAVSVTLTIISGAAMHTLYGDGVHDDSVALQAFINGEEVRWRNEILRMSPGGSIELPPGTYLTRPIQLP
jgi:hypothetical protein